MTHQRPFSARTSRHPGLILAAGAILLAAAPAFAQVPDWTYEYQGPSQRASGNIGKGICVAPNGDLITTGQASVDSQGRSDVVIARISPTGQRIWDFLYDGGDFDIGYGVAVDSQGNCYVAAESRVGNGNRFTIVSVDALGQQRWVYQWQSQSVMMAAFDITVAADGNIYATGVGSAQPNQDSNIVVVSVDPNGAERWKVAYQDARGGTGVGWAITTDAQSNVYVGGRTHGDAAVVSLTANGEARWLRRFHGSASGIFVENDVRDLTVGSDGNVYFAGKTDELGEGRDLMVGSVTSEGVTRWTYRYTGSMGAADNAFGIEWGFDGNVYVAGKSVESGMGDAMFIASLTPGGVERWKHFEVFSHGVNGANSVAVSNQGRVYACGWANNQNSRSTNFGVVALTTEGQRLYTWSSEGTSGTGDELVIGHDGGAYAAGFVQTGSNDSSLVVAAFDGGQPTYQLALDTSCPDAGPARVQWSGATPSRTQAVVIGNQQGNTSIPHGPCTGTQLGISGQITVVHTMSTGSGTGALNAQAGAGACGRWMQLVLVDSPCLVSNVVRIE